ncbi:MAG: alcohol dehydrogenase catalytic domain-containing protein [Deltaproteobacteria bacterium]|nr:alcohol dehydrogenase catalytic domain-containing protein [Deltaproteobacteria bacterium]
MKAALIYGPGDIRIEDIKDPTISDDEILVRVKTCGICGTDLHYYRAGDPTTKKPIIPGHEFSGEIVEKGSAVEGLKVGDKIVGTGLRDCGECYWCRHEKGFCPNPKVPGEGLDGAIAEYVIVPKPMAGALVFQIPESMTWNEAATIEPISISCFAVEEARISEGDIVAVLGAGMIGLGIIQACKAAGAAKVIVSEPSAFRREMAQKLGADLVLNPLETDLFETVADFTTGQMAGVIFECSGSVAAFCQVPQVSGIFGKVMQVGIFEQNLELAPDLAKLMFQFRNITVRGCGGQRWDKALEHILAGTIKTNDLVTQIFPLEEVKEAFATQLNSEKAIKVLIEMP